ncbi:hypothetical protein QCA50_014205 [Cerrena zonata]|uniref:ABC transmembrane type-1 domain-containing protein n=1 Tax=Cerrena zonata TaxID=2478898 RepID=A0AAW0FQ02_9APHY
MENRAYYMTISIQRWLSVRLDILGNILILGIALFAAGFRKTVDPSKIGVVLSYTLSITQTFSELVSVYAQNEQNFNAVEHVLHYTELPSEGESSTPNDPSPSWPDRGSVEFEDVELSYREGLPRVLKGVTFSIKPGEKIGIVGRTGQYISSIVQYVAYDTIRCREEVRFFKHYSESSMSKEVQLRSTAITFGILVWMQSEVV